jgi:uncharacterized protein (DUF779 family)
MAEITISKEAASRLDEFKSRPGGVAFKIDNGCCGGTTLLFFEATYLGSGDALVGEVEGVGVFVEKSLQKYYESDHYHIDVREGARESGFSLEVPHGFKFLMTRTAFGPPGESVLRDDRCKE